MAAHCLQNHIRSELAMGYQRFQSKRIDVPKFLPVFSFV